MKLVSWNVNGIRAILKKNFLKDVKRMDPDVLCIQETKAHPDQVDLALGDYPHHYWNAAEKKGYSGTAIFSKIKPKAVNYDFDTRRQDPRHDQEGRVITLEFPKFYLVNVYTPNAGEALKRLKFRMAWDLEFRKYIKKLDKKKPMIFCGDLNVAHEEMDLARPAANHMNAGFTDEERAGLTEHLAAGFIDTFRNLHPQTIKYSWWSYRMGARAKNVGWRIDYFCVAKALQSKVQDATIHNEVMGSDHCPVGLNLHL